MIEEDHAWFLKEYLLTDSVRHSGRTLWDHLAGTHRLLEEWGAPEDVKLAGLYHSIYGTNAFRHKCLDAANTVDHRAAVVRLIGARAELLAYVFCVTNRPKAFLNAAGDEHPVLNDMVTGDRLELTPKDIADLLEIEAANLLEQGGNTNTLWRLAACPEISKLARAALLQGIQAGGKVGHDVHQPDGAKRKVSDSV